MTTLIRRLPALSLIGVMLLCFIYGSSVPARQTIAANLQATGAATTSAPAAGTAGTVGTTAAGSAATAAGTSGAASLPTTRPVVQGSLNGTQLTQGIAGSYCWPDASPQCDFQDDPQPTASVSVNTGDTIAFTVEPASPAPADLHGLLLDDKGTDGALKIVDLASTNNSFTVDSTLANGPHRLEVDAIYNGTIQGNKPFVSTVYLLTVGGVEAAGTAGAQTGTEAVASVITATSAGSAATAQGGSTEQAATSAAVAATSEATTAAPTAAATTIAATVAVTVEAPTATQPVVVSVATVEPTTEVTTAATIEPTTATTVAPSPTATETPVPPTATPTIEPTIAPSFTPTETSTSENTSTGNSGQVVVTVVVTAVSNGATLAPISTAQVPQSAFIVEGHTYSYIAVNACSTGDGGATLCVNRPADSNAPRIVALPNDAAQIVFQGPRPTSVQVVIYTSDGVKVIKKDTLQPDNLMLYTLPSTPGNYVITTEITYPAGKVTYYYRVQISG